jgi:hypothetical protein
VALGFAKDRKAIDRAIAAGEIPSVSFGRKRLISTTWVRRALQLPDEPPS